MGKLFFGTMEQINKNNCNIWGTDNSGQISNTDNDNDIGIWTHGNKCEKVMAENWKIIENITSMQKILCIIRK